MLHSRERTLTTHTGSLPRPPALRELIVARERGESVDARALESAVDTAVREVVARQASVGLDIVNDGEMSKPSYATYARDRLTGFSGEGVFPMPADLLEYPRYAAQLMGQPGLDAVRLQKCTGPIAYRDHSAVTRDLQRLRAALAEVSVDGAFVTAASPGVISLFFENEHYPSPEDYVHALAAAMRVEYQAIHAAGFMLQVDCPDLAMGRHTRFASASLADFRRRVGLHLDALRTAIADIPPDKVHLHLCWGNYEGPHHRDVRLSSIIDLVLQLNVSGFSFPAANPRHEHEWRVWENTTLPPDRVLIPGVIDPTTNFIEHPDLVADRIERFAHLVGRERVVAGTDCGFGTFAGFVPVDPAIAWAKLESLVEGARRASERLW